MVHLRSLKLSVGLVCLVFLTVLAPAAAASPPAMPPADGFLAGCTGEYFNNITITGSPVVVRTDPAINFFWPEGTSPAPGINVNNYSVRWTCTASAPADGNYTFTMLTDDGMNLIVDGNLIIWAWYDQGPSSYARTIFLNAGAHTIRVEYYNHLLGGTAQVYSSLSGTVIPPPVVVGIWVGQYYNNTALAGSPVFLRNDTVLNFNWGNGSPDPSVPVDNFSARWDAYQNIPSTGYYTIAATSDDGVRVWLDGGLVIDGWSDHPPMTFTATRNLGAGLHAFHVEYYERGGGALVSVQITPGVAPPPPPPPPPPGGDVIVDDLGPGWQAGGTSTSWRGVPAGINGHAFWTFNNTYAAPYYNWARWFPTLSAPGNYEVSAYIPSGLASTLNARYWIYHAGRYDLAPRSQVFYANQWVSLGTYYFSAAGGEFVSLSDVTYECYLCRTLAWDAVRFSPR